MSDHDAITRQPQPAVSGLDLYTRDPGAGSVFGGFGTGTGEVIIRNMELEDSDFAGRMVIEAFRGKFEWAVGKDGIEGTVKMTQHDHRNYTSIYHLIFIAMYQGQRAGLMQLKYHDTKVPQSDDFPYCQVIGCWNSCRLTCVECALSAGSVPKTQVYLDHICVDSQFRGKGVGKALLQKADEEARRMGCQSIYLYVATNNRAKNLYERHGYSITDTMDGCCCTYCSVGIRKFYKMEKPL